MAGGEHLPVLPGGSDQPFPDLLERIRRGVPRRARGIGRWLLCGRALAGGVRIRVLFIPEPRPSPTTERTPVMYGMLKADHEVVGLPAPWDRFVYDTDRAAWPRYLLYGIDKALLGIRGLRLARRHRAEVVFCETSHHALPGLWIARMVGARCIWDSHGHVGLFSRSVGKGRAFSRLSTSLERFLGENVDALITVSERDAEAYAEMGVPRSRVSVIPLSIDLARVGPLRASVVGRGEGTAPGPAILLFFGNMKYGPNREALEFINGSLAPFLERKGIRCEIHIAGRDIPRTPFHRLVKPVGFVPDLYAAIRGADLCLVPVMKGVGTLTKVLDIMAAGTPVVVSAFAAASIPGLQDGVHALVAPDAEAFPELVVRALAQPEASRSMAQRARRLVEERYDRAGQRAPLQAILRGRPLEEPGIRLP